MFWKSILDFKILAFQIISNCCSTRWLGPSINALNISFNRKQSFKVQFARWKSSNHKILWITHFCYKRKRRNIKYLESLHNSNTCIVVSKLTIQVTYEIIISPHYLSSLSLSMTKTYLLLPLLIFMTTEWKQIMRRNCL